MASMGWGQSLQAADRHPANAVLFAIAFVLALSAAPVKAQPPTPTPTPTQTPTPTPTPTPTQTPTASQTPVPTPSVPMTNLSAGSAVTNLGSSFLERLGDQASGGFNRASRNNPGGGGASESTDGVLYRSW